MLIPKGKFEEMEVQTKAKHDEDDITLQLPINNDETRRDETRRTETEQNETATTEGKERTKRNERNTNQRPERKRTQDETKRNENESRNQFQFNSQNERDVVMALSNQVREHFHQASRRNASFARMEMQMHGTKSCLEDSHQAPSWMCGVHRIRHYFFCLTLMNA